jgi:hypothetical protein
MTNADRLTLKPQQPPARLKNQETISVRRKRFMQRVCSRNFKNLARFLPANLENPSPNYL